MSFYIKRTYVDSEPGIELVNIHYTWTPPGEMPNWEAHRETRMMPRGGVLVRGMGGTTVDESGQYVQTSSERIELPDDGTRRKVIRLPKAIPDPSVATGYTDNYAFHHYFEIFRNGKREQSALYTEEIVSKEVEYIDFQGNLGGMCIFWSVYDWDAPQYQPTEEANFVARFGEDNPYRSHKFYGAEDKENFSRIRSEMLRSLPLPRRYLGKIYGPKGSEVHQRWHVGNMWQPNPAERWEDYWGYVVHTL
ncbi:MAG TPA: hypothetical protein VKK81_15545 [Candidatus Binatia bacterium]|nr:hypothetical protein [Candidatus Binatia bacterium]